MRPIDLRQWSGLVLNRNRWNCSHFPRIHVVSDGLEIVHGLGLDCFVQDWRLDLSGPLFGKWDLQAGGNQCRAVNLEVHYWHAQECYDLDRAGS